MGEKPPVPEEDEQYEAILEIEEGPSEPLTPEQIAESRRMADEAWDRTPGSEDLKGKNKGKTTGVIRKDEES